MYGRGRRRSNRMSATKRAYLAGLRAGKRSRSRRSRRW